MNTSSRFNARFGILIVLLLILQLVMPSWSNAIELVWSTGTPDVNFTEGTRAVLIVRADSTEGVLPASWRLLWTADSSGVRFTALDSLSACEIDTARVSAIDPPASPADSSANEITAHFCSYGTATATTAYYLLDLVGGSRGKLKVVALNPVDSTAVIESNEATFNGGIGGDYAPVLLGASSVHQSLELQVTAVGSGLNGATSLSISAPTGTWNLPLTITTRSNSAVTGVASVAALLPVCVASVGSASGAQSATPLPADAEIQPDIPESGGCSAQYFEELVQPPPPGLGYAIQPKDFSFTPGFVDAATNRYALHLFYIRHSYYNIPADANEKNLGHAWSSDFISWHGPASGDKPDTLALTARTGSGKFDELHVWAPSIVRVGPVFHMFYTGVKNEAGRQNQRIGVATSTDLNTWAPGDTAVLSSAYIPWASRNPTTYPGQQLRDPFVMEDPTTPGQWLMYFVAVDSLHYPRMAVGVARSTDLRIWSAMPKPFSSTERPTSMSSATTIESPHVFKHNGQWWMPYTVDQNEVFFETSPSASPADTVAAHWTGPVWLRGVLQGRPAEVQYWHATEHLGSGLTEWLAAFDDNAISIDIKGVFTTDSTGVDSLLLDCPPKPPTAGVDDPHRVPGQLGLVVLQSRLGAFQVGLRIDLPWRTSVRLAVYDLAGRRLTTLVDRELPAGVTSLRWNGADDDGQRATSGIYFIRLSCAKGTRVSKVVMLR